MSEVVNNEKVIPFWKIIYKKLLLIVMLTVLFAILGLGYATMFVKPVYTAQTSLILKLDIGNDSTGKETQNTATVTSLYFPSVQEVITSSRAVSMMNKDVAEDVNKIVVENSTVVPGTTPAGNETQTPATQTPPATNAPATTPDSTDTDSNGGNTVVVVVIVAVVVVALGVASVVVIKKKKA